MLRAVNAFDLWNKAALILGKCTSKIIERLTDYCMDLARDLCFAANYCSKKNLRKWCL